MTSNHDIRYDRVFQRINNLYPRPRQQCKKILGWIGCAPTPLSTLEMEQAISITQDPKDETDDAPNKFFGPNFVRLCGPIVEVMDEKLVFVHFTVQEYV